MQAISRIAVIVLLSVSAALAQSPLSGHWEGAFVRENAVQLITLTITDSSGALAGTYAIPEMGLYEEPIRELTATGDSVTMRFRYGTFALAYAADIDQLTGSNERWNPPLHLHLKRPPLPPQPFFTKREVTFHNRDIALAGTVYVPIGDGPVPGVVLIHGGGDQPRTVWEYRSHLYGLVRCGVAVLIYDKRGSGESGGDFEASTLDDLANDAFAGLETLRQQTGVDPARCGVYGISQGGWVAAILGRQHPDLPFIVLNQGPAVSLWEQDIHRVEYSLRADGYTETAIDSAVTLTRMYFEAVADESTWFDYLLALDAADTAAWLEYAQAERTYDDEDMIWWRRNQYDPAADLAGLYSPVFAVFGEFDANVPPAENRSLMDSLLSLAGVEHEIIVVPNLPHSVTTYQTLRGGEWKWPKHFWQFAYRPAFDEQIAAWIHRR